MRDIVVPLPQLGPQTIWNVLEALSIVWIPILHASRQHWNRSAGMHGDEADVGITEHHAVGDDAGDGTGDVEIIFEHAGRRTISKIATAGWCQWVHEDHRIAPIELLP